MPLQTLIKSDIAPPATDATDARVGRWLSAQGALTASTRVAILGFPSDEGVRRNGGRVGAAQGPGAIRAALYSMTPDARAPDAFARLLERTVDLGDVPVSGNLESDQAQLGRIVAALLDAGVTPIVLGGGHETAYGHALGYLESGREVHLLNWDAHADVRPLRGGQAHSGSPFRQALNHPSGLAKSYTVAGLCPWRVSAEHARFVEDHGSLVWLADLTPERAASVAASAPSPTLATFDLDAVDGLPGVSAPGDGGLPAATWFAAAQACGQNPAITSFDVVELNPQFDVDGRSARIAALTVWQIFSGLASRE